MKTYDVRLPKMEQCIRITVLKDKIKSIKNIVYDESLPYVLPVLVDLQQNGALGTYFNTLCNKAPETLNSIADYIRKQGVGRCLLTLTTFPYEDLIRTAELIDKLMSEQKDLNTLFFGIFNEGIFLSPQEGWRGAHTQKWLLQPDYQMLKKLDDASGNRISVVNVAPEEPGGLDFIEEAVKAGIIVSLGHCNPSAEIIDEAVKRGASLVTHIGNGTAINIHRFNNPLWSFLNNCNLKAGFIYDGFHLPKDLIGTIIKSKGVENCFPISDASGFSGLPSGCYSDQGNREIVIEDNGFLHLKNSEILCGAWFQIDKAVSNLVKHQKMSFIDAWYQCSIIPANIIGINLPEIKEGEEASFVLAKWTDNLEIIKSIHLGNEYLKIEQC